MDILQQIQKDLLDPNVSLSNILRKAKVLAHQLKSKELSSWASQELDGYKSKDDLPDYRRIKTSCVGKWTNGAWLVSNKAVPLYKIKDDDLKIYITTYFMYDGVRSIEKLSTREEGHFILPPEITAMVNSYVSERGYGYTELELAISNHEFEQVLDTVRNRLLDFILQLSDSWDTESSIPSSEKLDNLVSVTIYNNPQGGQVMPIFDQRGQHVTYQYNAAGNINVENVSDKSDLLIEIDKFRQELAEIKKAKIISDDVAVEADYHLMKASNEAKKEKPNKPTFFDHIGKAKALFEDVTAAAGLVTALIRAMEVADKIL